MNFLVKMAVDSKITEIQEQLAKAKQLLEAGNSPGAKAELEELQIRIAAIKKSLLS